MKYMILTSVLILFTSVARAADGLCLPKADAGNQDWPICAIYMHGLFGSSAYPESTWEIPFRNKFEKIAKERKCKIAVPFGNKGNNRNWNGVSMSDIKKRAEAVCQGARFSATPDIIGFSNGANTLRHQNCNTLGGFGHVTLIGPTGTSGNEAVKKCGNVTIIQTHAVPSDADIEKTVSKQEAGTGFSSPMHKSAAPR